MLFLDEFSEFKAHTLELLRTPIEDRKITICRVNARVTYPSNFILIAAMNPCPCGYYGSKVKECSCSKKSIGRYLSKISGPLLDRFDLFVQVNSIKTSEINSKNNRYTSAKIRERVNIARNIQLERYENNNIYTNSELSSNLLKKFCTLDKKGEELLNKFYTNFKLSVRAYDKIIKVARTIADLEKKGNIEYKHIAEAIQYRNKEE